MNYYQWVRPLIMALPPEQAHQLTLGGLRYFGKLNQAMGWSNQTYAKPVQAMGLHFPNPVGLAAGLDKNGVAIAGWQALGLGFVEVGTVTPKPQAGNAKPRLFRLKSDQAIINRMGFNNEGVSALLIQLKKAPHACPIGVNIGKNKDTSIENAVADYVSAYRQVYAYSDYVTLNISSPNTQNLRELQQDKPLLDLLQAITEERKKLRDQHGQHKPLVVKIAPDLSESAVKQVAEILLNNGIEGIIATNTTLSRAGLTHPLAVEAGGLSGRPLHDQALQVLRWLQQAVGKDLTLIASGGIMSGADAVERQQAGAQLVQLYTGLIYAGPALIRACCAQM